MRVPIAAAPAPPYRPSQTGCSMGLNGEGQGVTGQAADGNPRGNDAAAVAAAEPAGPVVADSAAATALAGSPGPGLERARARLDQALSRLEQATIALLARKSAMEVDRRGLTETARSLQAERAELRGFILDSAEILDSLIARAEAAMAEEPEEPPFTADGYSEDDDSAADMAEGDSAEAAYASARGSMELPGLPQRRLR